MTPEQTFLTELVSGRLPAMTALILIFMYIVYKGGAKLDKLTTAVEAVPLALASQTTTQTAANVDLKTHVTSETERVIAVIEDRRLSEMGEAVASVSRAVSDPDLAVAPRRSPTGSRAAIR